MAAGKYESAKPRAGGSVRGGRVAGRPGDWGRAAEGPGGRMAGLPCGRAVHPPGDQLQLAAALRPPLTTYSLLLTVTSCRSSPSSLLAPAMRAAVEVAP